MKPTEYRRRRDLIWRRVRQQMRSILLFDGVPVTPEQREDAAQKILFPVRRARDESAQLATAFYNDEAVRAGRQPSRPRRAPFYPPGAIESVLERATSPKIRIDGLDVVPATPTQTARVEGLEVAPTRGVVIEGLDDLGVELEHARVEIDESNRRDPAVVEKVNQRVDRAIIRHIEQAARDTVKAAVEAEEERSGDPIGWARVLTGAESCGFCAMLASRGPIYKTEETAQRRGKNQEEDKYHDGCDCLIVPVFDIDDDWVGKDAWENLEQLWIESDGRKDFEKRFRQIRDDGDVDQYIGAIDPTSSGGDPPDNGADTAVTFADDPDDAEGIEQEFAGWAQERTADEIEAVTRWQGTDRFYQRVQQPTADDAEARSVRDEMEDLVYSHELAQDRELWRGIRSCEATFGMQSSDLESLIGREFTPNQFTAATSAREVAEREFSQPSLRGGNAMIRVRARKGTPAAYLAPIGDPKLAYQREVLFPPGISMRIVGVDRSSTLPVIVVDLWRSV
ncbi:hypothetical protein JVX90_13770 [Gordonia sp. PDNC005]|uniref:VG15 protein n=1 Tax=Gordonia sp. PDNC005 TaxID=2811424 RepID=UPI0019652047|nr:hypothetical protein [Gordonia sp. PDNC005]QRY61480.1 hypothetical protein JVX90_13770 [Gordonia sp. PDNC005]